MTTAIAVEDQLFHPLNPLTYQLTFARTELSTLVAELREIEAHRRSLIVQGVIRPAEELELKNIEKQIGIVRLKIDHINIKIEGLIEEIPRVDIETRNAVQNLETAKEKLPKVLAELETLDAELVELCENEAIQRLVTMVKNRNALADELTYALPK